MHPDETQSDERRIVKTRPNQLGRKQNLSEYSGPSRAVITVLEPKTCGPSARRLR